MISIDRRLLLGPEPYSVEELSETSKERRLLDGTCDPTKELEEFREFVQQSSSEQQAWQIRFTIDQLLPEVRVALSHGDKEVTHLEEFNQLCGELFLAEEENKLMDHLKPWAYEMVEEPDWEHPATRELWRRFQLELDEAWPSRKRFLQMRGELREEGEA